jgi:pimeloyl-ACP methyl ester carboxylesterase
MTTLMSSRAAVGAVVGVMLVAGACSTAHASPGTSTRAGSSSSTPPASTPSPVSTTLPVPLTVPGTSPAGGDAFLGPIKRVPVAAVRAGGTSAPLPVAGQRGYLAVEHIAFRRFGSGKDLLLIMGQDGTMTWWEPSLLSVLAQHYNVTIFDLPGVGYSDPVAFPVSVSWLADETAGLIHAVSLSSPTVVGWGLGGDVALSLAERHPASLGSLVLVDTSAGGPGAVRPASSISSRFESRFATASSLASTIFGSSVPASASSAGSASEASAWLAGISSDVPDDISVAGLAEERTVQLGVWSGGPLAQNTDLVTVPTLVAFGAGDSVFPSPDGSVLAASIVGAQTVTLPGTGYGSLFESPSLFVSSLEHFTR